MNTKKIVLLFLVFLYHTLYAQLLIKEDFKNVFVYENSCKLISYELSKENENIIKTFEIDVLNQGEYYIYAWIFGNEKSKKLNVNFGKSLSNSFDFENDQSNWHFTKIINKREFKENFYFDKGKNSISFTTSIPEVPQIEFIILSKNLLPPESLYDKYVDSLQSNPFIDAKANNFNKLLSDGPPFESNPVYDYDYRMNITYSYSYWTTFYFYAGTNVTFETKKSNPYGSDPVMYLCCGTYPIDGSWADDDGGSGYQSKISTIIPKNGFYYLIIRSYSLNAGQTSDLWFNGSLYASNIPLNGHYTSSSHNTTEELNYFTSHNSAGDPRLWLECYSSTHNRILWWNDNFEGGEDYDWLLNARVKKAFDSDNYPTGVLVTSSSYYPTGTCDLYLGCKNGTHRNSSFPNPTFPNLQSTDAILAHFCNQFTIPVYNCHAWTGGITNYWIVAYHDSDCPWWEVPGSPLQSYDNYYSNIPYLRYNGAPNYTRVGTFHPEAVIDLWGTTEQAIQHSAIKKPGNNYIHGYDWESKNGYFERIFHPRTAINGGPYGNVLYSYRPSGSYTIISKNEELNILPGNGYSLQESVEAGLSVVENVTFDSIEIEKINSFIKTISSAQYSEYKTKIENVINSDCLITDDNFKKSNLFKSLLNFCLDNKLSFLALLFKDFSSGKSFLRHVIDSLTLKEYKSIKANLIEKYKKNRFTDDGKYIVPNPNSIFMHYIKEILKEMDINTINTQLIGNNKFEPELGVSLYNNPNPFNPITSIRYTILKAGYVSLKIYDVLGREVAVLVNQVKEPGEYKIEFNAGSLSSGIYICKLHLDEFVFTRKMQLLK